jgi:hypothetical protein
MQNINQFLLIVDGLINIFLGLILLFIPFGLDQFLGIPIPVHYFYPTILGGILFGIGISLLIERYSDQHHIRDLGLGGAIVINFCGVAVLIFWLLVNNLNIPLRGLIILWTIALLVLITGIVELSVKYLKK